MFALAVKRVSKAMYFVSCGAIVIIVVLTVLDVILRRLGAPIDFAYEIACLLAAVVVGFALPHTSVLGGHVTMEFLETKVSLKWKAILRVITRCTGIAIFGVIGWQAIRLGNHLREANQVSAVLELPEYPVAYALAACFLVECLVLASSLKENEEEHS
jgi:TRAP-type C4-dicarboxylate transport system permease small subunit